ncbi:MAG: hypothetical protein ABIQ39_06110 [Ilumatobacteraceae bacterium]
MGWIQDKAAQADQMYQALMPPLLTPDEQLLGVCQATQRTSFSNKTFVIGVMTDRFVLVQVDRKLQMKDEPISVRREDITKSSVDGFGGGLAQFLSAELGDIRVDTSSGSYKLMILGGGMDQALTGQGQLNGKTRFLEFLASARGIH